MSGYQNTLTIKLGRGSYLARPPRGATAAAWDRLRAAHPQLDGARVHEDAGGMLQVEVERMMGAHQARRQVVEDLAGSVGVEMASYADAGPPRTVTHYLVVAYAGVTVVVSTRICECHDGLEATLGVFPDAQDVIAEAVGKALRQLVPAEHHGGLAAAEALLDAELTLRQVT
jgi:hypothetical protein